MAEVRCATYFGDTLRCCDGPTIGLGGEITGASQNDCRGIYDGVCQDFGGTGFDEFGDGSTCSSVASKKPRLTSGISRMRSATGEAGAVSNDTIRKYAQFALVISLVALSVNIYSMRKNK